MSDPSIRLAVRDWDHVVPLLLGDVQPEGVDLTLETRPETPSVLAEAALDGGETSLSRYTLARAAGDDRLVGLPVFLMRGFRQRCVMVRADSPLTSLAELSGSRVGLTGWPDSGNTWTRALVREAGVDLADVEWVVGSMTSGVVDPDRLGRGPLPANIRASASGRPLWDDLARGALDAIMTPFMPPGHFEADAPIRHLMPDYRADEHRYFERYGFVPGIHLLTLKRATVDAHPWLPQALVTAFERSKRTWWQRRQMLLDTTPWQLADLELTAAVFGADWMPYGVAANRSMVDHFAIELFEQGIAPERIETRDVFDADLFDEDLELTEEPA